MMWDRLFWLWFAVTAVFYMVLLSEEAGTTSLLFGSLLVGLGLIKLAGERSPGPRLSRRILKRLAG